MDYFLVEIKSIYGLGPWKTVNAIKAENGRMAIILANRIRVRCFGSQIPRESYRVRRVEYEEYAREAQALMAEYNRHGQMGDRFEELESVHAGCKALIDPR
jgi:hypothetical protein